MTDPFDLILRRNGHLGATEYRVHGRTKLLRLLPSRFDEQNLTQVFRAPQELERALEEWTHDLLRREHLEARTKQGHGKRTDLHLIRFKNGQHHEQVAYRILEKRGKAPEQIELVLEYAKSFTKAPGSNSVSFQATPPL